MGDASPAVIRLNLDQPNFIVFGNGPFLEVFQINTDDPLIFNQGPLTNILDTILNNVTPDGITVTGPISANPAPLATPGIRDQDVDDPFLDVEIYLPAH